MAAIDRRNFLGLFSAAALAAIAPFDRLIRVGQPRFTSPALAFSLDVPDSWSHWSIEDIVSNRDRQVYIDERRAPDELSPTPMVAFSRYKEPYPDLNPGVCIYADRRADWMGKDIVVLTDSVTEYFSTIVRDAQISKAVVQLKFPGCEAANSTIIYEITNSNGFRCRVVDNFLLAFHQRHLIFFQFEQSFDGHARADREFEAIERSLRFA